MIENKWKSKSVHKRVRRWALDLYDIYPYDDVPEGFVHRGNLRAEIYVEGNDAPRITVWVDPTIEHETPVPFGPVVVPNVSFLVRDAELESYTEKLAFHFAQLYMAANRLALGKPNPPFVFADGKEH